MAARYNAVDAVLLLALAVHFHGTDAAVRAIARNIIPQLPNADRHGVRKILNCKQPVKAVEQLLTLWASINGGP
jgi:hypothetical protein